MWEAEWNPTSKPLWTFSKLLGADNARPDGPGRHRRPGVVRRAAPFSGYPPCEEGFVDPVAPLTIGCTSIGEQPGSDTLSRVDSVDVGGVTSNAG